MTTSADVATSEQQSTYLETPLDIKLPGEYTKPLSRALAAYGLDKKAERAEAPTKTRSRGWANKDRTEFYEDRQITSSMLRSDPIHAASLSRNRFEQARGFARLAGKKYALVSITFRVRKVSETRADVDRITALLEATLKNPVKQALKGSRDGHTLSIEVWSAAPLSPEEDFTLRANLGSRATVEVRTRDNDAGGVAAANDLREVLSVVVPESPRRQAKLEAIVDGTRTVKTYNASRLQRQESKLFAYPKKKQITSDGPLIDMPFIRPKSPKTGLPYHWMTVNWHEEGVNLSQLPPDHWVECPPEIP